MSTSTSSTRIEHMPYFLRRTSTRKGPIGNLLPETQCLYFWGSYSLISPSLQGMWQTSGKRRSEKATVKAFPEWQRKPFIEVIHSFRTQVSINNHSPCSEVGQKEKRIIFAFRAFTSSQLLAQGTGYPEVLTQLWYGIAEVSNSAWKTGISQRRWDLDSQERWQGSKGRERQRDHGCSQWSWRQSYAEEYTACLAAHKCCLPHW